MKTIIECTTRQNARDTKKELGGKIIDRGTGVENRWAVEIEVQDVKEVQETVLPVLCAQEEVQAPRNVLSLSTARKGKAKTFLRHRNGKQTEVITKGKMHLVHA